MDTLTIIILISSFSLSLLFSLGGVGAAVALVPLMSWLGLPINLAKSIGLFTNTISLSGASYFNIKNKKLDFKLAAPIIISSGLFAPLGAWSSNYISKEIALIIFILFLFLSGSLLLFFKGAGKEIKFKEKISIPITLFIGAFAGMISGLLGVGGGSLISPALMMMRIDPKKVASVTAFVVPFSSFLGFITYASIGKIQWKILILVAGFAYLGGYIGTKIMQNKMKSKMVKKLLGVILFVIGIKLFLQIL